GSTISNASTGTFDAQSDAQVVLGFLGAATFSNAGTFKKSAGAGTTNIGFGVFNNTGLVQVQSGTLRLDAGGGTHTGSFSVAAGATLEFAGTTHSLNAGSAVTGAGTVAYTGGTATIVGAGYALAGTTRVSGLGIANFNSTASTGGLDLSAGTLGGSGELTVTGLATWTGGTMSGAGETVTAGVLQI